MLLCAMFQWMCCRGCSCGSVKSSTLSVVASAPHKRYSVGTCTVWLGMYYSHLNQSLFDRNWGELCVCVGGGDCVGETV